MVIVTMRQAVTTILPQRFAYFILLALLFILLAVVGSETNQTKTSVQGDANASDKEVATSDTDVSSNNSEVSNNSSGENKNKSTITKLNISLNTSSENNETTGFTNVSITQNGQTQTFEEVFDGSRVRIDVDNGEFEIDEDDGRVEVDFDSRNKSKTENETSFEQNVKIEKESD